MRSVQPNVFLIAKTELNQDGMAEYLEEIGAPNWETDAHSQAEELCEVAMCSCYMSFNTDINPNIQQIREGNALRLANVIKSGHGSVLEHANATFAFTKVARVLTHELVRHRMGGFSQESLRFVRLDDIPFWTPPALHSEDEELDVKFEEVILEAVSASEWAYEQILQLCAEKEGVDNFDDLPFERKKYYTSAARRVAPIGTATNIIWTTNMRNLRHVIEMRCHESAEEEIRLMFGKIVVIAKTNWPALFDDYTVEFDKNSMPLLQYKHKKV